MSNTLIPQEIEDMAALAAATAQAEAEAPVEGETHPLLGFSIEDESKANWVLAKVAEIGAEFKRADAMAVTEITRIREWIQTRERIAKRQMDWFGMALEGFARQRFEESGGKTKTIKLPHGQLALRDQPPKWEWVDEAAVVEILREVEPEALRVTVEIDKAALKKVVNVNSEGEVVFGSGLILEGVRVTTDATPKFTFKAE